MVCENMTAGSDSGYESADAHDEQALKPEKQEFELRANYVFVTYTQSQVEDKNEFYRYFQELLNLHAPVVKGGAERAKVEIFGSKELHKDGGTHYHVAFYVSERLHWRQARKTLTIYIDVDGKRVADTESIFIRKKQRWESPAKFLKNVQQYIAKDGDTFGTWIECSPDHRSLSAAEKEKHYDELIAAETQDECKQIYTTHFKKEWCLNHGHCEAFMRTKKGQRAVPHVHRFENVMPWKVPEKLLKWKRDNIDNCNGRRPRSLVIIGRPHTGKTEWAMSFGRPIEMTGKWNLSEMLKTDYTHLVLNDIDFASFAYKRELAGCQRLITATGKYRGEHSIEFNKPVIFTCNKDNNVLKDRMLNEYLHESDAVIVKIRNALFEEKKEVVKSKVDSMNLD